ncbi:unnamed protein product [Rhodiola kirilowii]
MSLVQIEPSELQADGQSDTTPVVAASLSGSPTKPQLTKSVNELRALSTVLHTFSLRYDDLQNHLDSIQESINLCAEELRGPDMGMNARNEVDEVTNSFAAESPLPENPNPNSAIGDGVMKQISSRPELEILCEAMSGKGLRKYLAVNLDNLSKLREEVPKALNLSPSPAKLVLEAVGKFYLQGSRAYTKDSPMISGRQAAILVLEYYLLSDCGKEVDDEVKAEAESGAAAWRKRLLLEGGIHKASEIDARGLLLFIGSFGIPSVFRRDDVISMILLSDPRGISDALKRSCHIFPAVSDWIPKMIKSGMGVKAISIAYTFGLDNEFQPHGILTSHLKESKDSYDRKKRDATPQRAMEAAEKHLFDLKSIIKCLEYHEIDPSKLLPGWKIKEMIVKAEKDIVNHQKKLEAKALQKRKIEEMESHQKRQRYTTETSIAPGQLTGLHDGRSAIAHVDHYNPYDIGRRYVGSYSGLRDEILVDKFGQIVIPSGQSYGLKVVNAAYDERLAAAQAISGKYVGDSRYSLFAPSSSLEGFPGVQTNPSSSATARTSISDQYQFVDSIEGGHSRYNSISHQAGADAAPSQVIPDQQASYYYQ